MPNEQKDLTHNQKSTEEMLVEMLKEMEQNIMDLSQRVDVLEQGHGEVPLQQ